MNIALWVVQILLAAVFLGAGLTKMSQPREKLQPKMTWVVDYPAGGVRAIGAAEVIGALGLILPWATGIAKVLTPLAAVGLAIIMAGAVFTHAKRKEPWIPQLVLLALTIFVAIGRF